MAQDTNFESMLRALEGVTVLPAPRVSRETIIQILKDHTTLLADVQSQIGSISGAVRKLINTADDNKNIIDDVLAKVKENKDAMASIDQRLIEFRIDIDEIKSRIDVLPEMKEQIQDNKISIQDLSSKFKYFQGQFSEYMITTSDSIAEISALTKATDAETKALRHYVDHFGDNLTLSSTQIIVESTAGISKKPMSLLDVCTGFNANFINVDGKLEDHDKRIVETTNAVNTKADASLIFDVQTIAEELKAIQEHLKRDEDQGINAIRRTCEQLTVIIDGIQISLLEKVDRNTTEMIVHQKYEDIVQYLHDALQANAEDEENFKNIAKSLQESVEKVSRLKVDRTEIAPMQEAIAQTEAIVFKMRQIFNDVKDSRDTYSKVEMDALLLEKLDKLEFESKLAEIAKWKKPKRFSVQGNGNISGGNLSFADSDDEMDNRMKLRPITPKSMNTITTSPGVVNRDKFDASKWNGLSRGGELKQPGRPTTTGFPVNAPGQFRQNSESGQSGGLPGGLLPSIGSVEGSSVQNRMLTSQSAEGLSGVPHIRDTSFLGAYQMGGGFNTHSKHQLRQPESRSPDLHTYPDIEGEDLMIRGTDGHLYYTDAIKGSAVALGGLQQLPDRNVSIDMNRVEI